MNWFVWALAAGLASALNVWVSKLLLTKDVRPIVLGGVVHLSGGIICLLAMPFVTLQAQLTWQILLGLLFMALVYVLSNILYFSALASTQLSEIDILLRSSSLWTFIGGVILLREPAPPHIVLAALLIISSVFLTARQGRWRFQSGQHLALGAAVGFAAGNIIDKALSSHFDPLSYTTINLLLTGIGMLAISRASWPEIKTPILWRWSAWTVALTFALTQLLIILAFQAGGSAGQVILVAQVRLLILTVVGMVLLKETDRLNRKTLALVLMVGGISQLYQ